MTGRLPRRFTVLSILLLVAVTSVGMSGIRFVHQSSTFDPEGYVLQWRMNVDGLALYSSPMLIAWTLFVLLHTLVRPWPSFRTAVGQPGFVACVAAVIALIDATIYFAVCIFAAQSAQPPIPLYYLNACSNLIENAGWLIIGSWLALALAARWRPGPTWVDRFGCFVGCCWSVEFAIHHGYFRLFHYFGL
jgi:hypothetical protein